MRLIDADVYIKRVDALQVLEQLHGNSQTNYRFAYARAYNCVKNLPTVDLKKHGRWIREGDHTVCSVCNRQVIISDVNDDVIPLYMTCDYCPNCGAKMDEVKNESNTSENH